MKITHLFTALLLTATSLWAQENIKLTEENLSFAEGTKHSFESIDGKNVLVLNGRAQVKGISFSNGTVEVDIYANQKRSFAGITFRKQDDTFEEVYIRMHKSGLPDAVQYNPVFNMESNWQLYPEHQAAATIKKQGWNSLKVEVSDNIAAIYVNENQIMTVPNLKTDHRDGGIGLFALFENRFANLRISDKAVKIEIPTIETSSVEGLITEWQISEPQTYVAESFNLQNLTNVKYTINGTTENSGLLPISKYVVKPSRGQYRRNDEDYVVVATVINSSSDTTKYFVFDYSDRIIVFLNGELLFEGNNGFLFKNGQYQGHLSLDTNTVPLDLRKGDNQLQCIVIEQANGWGLMGKIID